MSKLRCFGRKCAALGATAATFCSNTVASLLSKRSNTVATQHGTLNWLLSLLIPTFYSRVGSNSSNTFPNLSQENISSEGKTDYSSLKNDLIPYSREEHDANNYQMDEFDHEDYDEWWYDAVEDYVPQPRPMTEESWHKRAVDEAIAEEENDNSIGDIPF